MNSPSLAEYSSGARVFATNRYKPDSVRMSSTQVQYLRWRGYAARVVGVDCRRARRWYQRPRGALHDIIAGQSVRIQRGACAASATLRRRGCLRYIAIDCIPDFAPPTTELSAGEALPSSLKYGAKFVYIFAHHSLSINFIKFLIRKISKTVFLNTVYRFQIN